MECHLGRRGLVSSGAAWTWQDGLQIRAGSHPRFYFGIPWSFSSGITLNRACFCLSAPDIKETLRSPDFTEPENLFCLCCKRLSPSNCTLNLNTHHINELARSYNQFTKPHLLNRQGLIFCVSWANVSSVVQHIHLIFWELCTL